jgi:hypothetical protein
MGWDDVNEESGAGSAYSEGCGQRVACIFVCDRLVKLFFCFF